MSNIFGNDNESSGSGGPTAYDLGQDVVVQTIANTIPTTANLNPIYASIDDLRFRDLQHDTRLSGIDLINSSQDLSITNLRNTNDTQEISIAARITKAQADARYYPLSSNPSDYLTNASLSIVNSSISSINNQLSEINTTLDSIGDPNDLVRQIDVESINTALDSKASIFYVDTQIATRASTASLNAGLALKVNTSDYNTQVSSINGAITSINSVNVNQDSRLTALEAASSGFQTAEETPCTPFTFVNATNTQQALEILQGNINNIAVGSGFSAPITTLIQAMESNYLTFPLITNVLNTPTLRAKWWSDISAITQRLAVNGNVAFGATAVNLGGSLTNGVPTTLKRFAVRGNWFNENNDTDIFRVDQNGDIYGERRAGLGLTPFRTFEITNAGANVRFQGGATITTYSGNAPAKSIEDLINENQVMYNEFQSGIIDRNSATNGQKLVILRNSTTERFSINNNGTITINDADGTVKVQVSNNRPFYSYNSTAAAAQIIVRHSSNTSDACVITNSGRILLNNTSTDTFTNEVNATKYELFGNGESKFQVLNTGTLSLFGNDRITTGSPSFSVDSLGNTVCQQNMDCNQSIANFFIDKVSGKVREHYYNFSGDFLHIQAPADSPIRNQNSLKNQLTNTTDTNVFRNFQIVGSNNEYRSAPKLVESNVFAGSLLYGNENFIDRMSLGSILFGNKNNISKGASVNESNLLEYDKSKFIVIGTENTITDLKTVVSPTFQGLTNHIVVGHKNQLSGGNFQGVLTPDLHHHGILIGTDIDAFDNDIIIGYNNKAHSILFDKNNCITIGHGWTQGAYFSDDTLASHNSVLLGQPNGSNPTNLNIGSGLPTRVNANTVPIHIAISRPPSGKYGVNSIVREFSSRRYKENIKTKNYNLDDFMKLRPVEYTNKNDVDKTVNYGLIAEEVNEIQDYKPFVAVNDEGQCEAIDYSKMVSMLINVIQQQQQSIQTLKSEIEKIWALRRPNPAHNDF